jgi:hypothetical protein
LEIALEVEEECLQAVDLIKQIVEKKVKIFVF